MKNKILVISFLVIIYGFFFINILVPDQEISKSERRKLQQFPELDIDDILDKDFMEDFDDYSVEQFVLRDEFRSLKASYSFNVLGMLDNNGYFVKDDVIYKSLYPTNKKSINDFIKKIRILNDNFNLSNNVYISIIPDKSYYLDDDKYLGIDYDYLYEEVKKIPYRFIDLRSVLSIDDYYRTDTHWRQERLENVVRTINKSMGNETSFNYKENKYEPFYGVYYGHAALKLKGDVLTYLTNDTLDKVIVEDIEGNNKLYDIDSLDGLDSYDVFVGGSTPLVKITNLNSKSKKELIMFRDSFGSSLAPLLVENYKSVTLVDMRYMTMDVLKEKVDFNNKDILIIYNTLLVNESNTLKIW